MHRLSDFLSRFRGMTPPDDALKKALARAVQASVGAPVNIKDISLSNGIAFIRVSSVAKNAIRLARGKILNELVAEYPKARGLVRDIR